MPPVKKRPHSRAATFLREWRLHRQLSQQRAAERIGIDYTTLGRIERGKLPYNQDLLERAAAAYGCEPFELLSTDPLKPEPPRLIWDRLRDATPELQAKAMAVLEVLLKQA